LNSVHHYVIHSLFSLFFTSISITEVPIILVAGAIHKNHVSAVRELRMKRKRERRIQY
jgi:hypothetical protein